MLWTVEVRFLGEPDMPQRFGPMWDDEVHNLLQTLEVEPVDPVRSLWDWADLYYKRSSN